MSITHLRSFVEVYRQGSVSKAAVELGLTQPAVSGHIASLEAQLERKLFFRHARGVKPTVIADELSVRVSAAMDTAENVLAEFKARSINLAGSIHVCGHSDILSDLLADRLLLLTNEAMAVYLHPTEGAQIASRLLEGRADFALGVDIGEDQRIESAVYGEEDLVLVAAPGMAAELAQAADLASALVATPAVGYDHDRRLASAWFEHNGFDDTPWQDAVVVPDLRAIRNFTRQGYGWSILPGYLVKPEAAAGSLVVIPGPAGNPRTAYSLFWLKSAMRNPRTARARTLLMQAAATASQE